MQRYRQNPDGSVVWLEGSHDVSQWTGGDAMGHAYTMLPAEAEATTGHAQYASFESAQSSYPSSSARPSYADGYYNDDLSHRFRGLIHF